ncbi:phosphatidylinositol mannoside acyltransferase [Timonella senegalensis]|uniref:phosphatidylinositol mannoside acyltransferase n=1 Tax=Timonella senegalensis TaxID=1465825 RepID=UPI0028A810FB|nr:phosphatidylinositol mannoside acyltransferase [Timonella senegalensis]
MAFNLFGFAWKHAHKVPAPIFRGALNLGADFSWLTKAGGVKQLEKNLGRVRPELDHKGIRKLSRMGMRSYMRYYGEAFILTSLTQEQVDARVRTEGDAPIRAAIAAGKAPILGLSHQGNWDLAGVWASRELAPVLTVAERLKPEEVFQEFLAFRQKLGMRILAAGDQGVFRELLRSAGRGGEMICLLADRDLSASGVEVTYFGTTARVAAGPAALAVGANAPLFPTGIFYERLTGARRKAAGSPWGIVLKFHPAVEVPAEGSKNEKIAAVSQAWINQVAQTIHEHPEDWHMLQKVFIEDLDPERYAKALQKADEHGAA